MNEEQLLSLCKSIVGIACEAGAIISSAKTDSLSVKQKNGDHNFVTDYDVKVQRFLRGALSRLLPDADFMGEEDEKALERNPDRPMFVVDPIDGTSNFMSGLDLSVVSIALCMPESSSVLVGCVHCPYRNETFFAVKNMGAYKCPGSDTDRAVRLQVTDLPIDDCVNAFGSTPYDRSVTPLHFELLQELFGLSVDVRNLGTAALHCAYIAAGIFGAFYEVRLQVWDYAAGALLVTEAGGAITDFKGEFPSLLHPDSIVAGSKANHSRLLASLQKHLPR